MTDDIKDRAEAQFKKEERASEAMAQYKAAVEAERAKTERLRALNLMREILIRGGDDGSAGIFRFR